jgi:hypothetical protein
MSTHNTTEIPKLVDIYATLNRMRVLSSPKVVAEADNALRMIINTYAKENTTFSGIRQSISHGFPDPLRAFSEACHEELKMYWSLPTHGIAVAALVCGCPPRLHRFSVCLAARALTRCFSASPIDATRDPPYGGSR